MEDEELSFSPEQDGGDDDTPQMPEGQSDELGLAFTLGSNDPLVEGSPTTAGIPKAKKPRTIQVSYSDDPSHLASVFCPKDLLSFVIPLMSSLSEQIFSAETREED